MFPPSWASSFLRLVLFHTYTECGQPPLITLESLLVRFHCSYGTLFLSYYSLQFWVTEPPKSESHLPPEAPLPSFHSIPWAPVVRKSPKTVGPVEMHVRCTWHCQVQGACISTIGNLSLRNAIVWGSLEGHTPTEGISRIFMHRNEASRQLKLTASWSKVQEVIWG